MDKLQMPFGLEITEPQDKVLKVKDIKSGILNVLSMLEDDEPRVIAHVRLTRIQKAVDAILKDSDYRDDAIESFNKVADAQNLKKATVDDSEVSYATTHTRYEYNECNHPVLDFLTSVTSRFKDLTKSLEAEIKLIPQETIEVVENDFDNDKAVTKKVGGHKKVYIDSNEVIEKLKFVIDDAQALIDTVESNDGIFDVNAPKIIRTMGLKVLKG